MLVHVCCANCYLHFLDQLKKTVGDETITLYYNNPNIHPRSEWVARLQALKKVNQAYNFDLKVANYRPDLFFKQIKPLVDKPKLLHSSVRCNLCWALRLKSSFEYAKENGFNQVTTTMLISQHQDYATIKRIGANLAKQYGIEFYAPATLKPCEDQHFCGFYKQNYCGCVYSLAERMEEKYLT